VNGPNTPAIEEDEIWLNDVCENSKVYKKVERFPRESDQLWNNLPRFDPQRTPRTRWLINSFLAEGSIQLVFGERGSFKSTLLLAAAKAVAKGEEFLGMKTGRRRVLVVDYENPAGAVKTRNDDLGLKLGENGHFKLWDRFNGQPPPKPDDPLLEAIVKECVAETGHGPWIIFDRWASLLKAGEGGEFTGQIAPIYLHLRKLSDAGATVTVIDHTRKHDKNSLYGGQDKEAKADTIHTLVSFPNKLLANNPIIQVRTWLKRFAPQGEGSFSFEVQSKQDEKGNWHISGLLPAIDLVEKLDRWNRPEAVDNCLFSLSRRFAVTDRPAVTFHAGGLDGFSGQGEASKLASSTKSKIHPLLRLPWQEANAAVTCRSQAYWPGENPPIQKISRFTLCPTLLCSARQLHVR
jgi:AAA domain